MSMRLNKLLGFVAMSVFFRLFTSCQKPPDFSDVPVISFNSIQYNKSPANTVQLSINFQDGNGNIGLSDADTSILYNFEAITLMKMSNGKFQSVKGLADSGNYAFVYKLRMPLIDPNNSGKPLSGVITTSLYSAAFAKNYAVKFNIDTTYGFNNQVVMFQVTIWDRAGNQSNTIFTDPIKITN